MPIAYSVHRCHSTVVFKLVRTESPQLVRRFSWWPIADGRLRAVRDGPSRNHCAYGLPCQARALSMAAAAAENAARRASSSDAYTSSDPPVRGTLCPASSNSARDVQAPADSCLVVTMTRLPWYVSSYSIL